MGKIQQEKQVTLREEVSAGYITEKIKSHLIKEKKELERRDSKSWDRRFITDMLSCKSKLTGRQIVQLDRILSYKMFEEEYPGGVFEFLATIDIDKK